MKIAIMLTEDEYYYLSPVYRKQLINMENRYTLVIENELQAIKEVMNQLANFYDYYEEIADTMVEYCIRCHSFSSIRGAVYRSKKGMNNGKRIN